MRLPRGILGLLLTVSCTALATTSAAEHTTDSLDTVKKNVAAKKAVLLDVREKSEWDDGHLQDATLVPLSDLEDPAGAKRLIERLPKGKIVYTHCAAGKRSVSAAKILKRQGWDVRPLKAGYKDLIEAGFPKAEASQVTR